jgi:outer membrane receptor protein involved in Fe transport
MKNNRFDHVIRKTALYLALPILSLIISGTLALAQSAKSSDESKSSEEEFSLEEITVTGSRLRTTGMDTPTPVNVVVLDEIEVSSPTTVVEGLAELPQFFGSNTTQNTGGFFNTSGAGSLNLRGLQSKRTLQLLDGRRVVPSTIFGGPDVNLFPETLLRSVETVTGGASAAYGTDAVAGVVNFILNTEYEGIKGNVQWGETRRGHNENKEYQIAGGFAVTDRTHVLFSAEKGEQDPIYGYQLGEYEWYHSTGLVKNPSPTAGTTPDNPFFIPVNNLYTTTASPDGILRFADPVGWYTFDGNGYAIPYVKGTGLCTSNGQLCEGTEGSSLVDTTLANADATQITPESGRENYFGYIEHEISSKLKVYGQAMLGKSYFVNKNFGGIMTSTWGAFTVYRGNPFLPQNIQNLMAPASETNPTGRNIASVQFARIGSPEDIAFDPYTEQRTKTLSLTTGFDYTVGSSGFFDDWKIKGYIQHGKTDVKAIQRGGIRLDRIYLAMDAVIDPLTGQPACNVTVTTRGTANPIYQDCVPINLFGAGNASQEAIDWVTGFEPGVEMNAEGFLSATESLPHSYISGNNKQRIIEIEQNVYEIMADGELYKGWGAGPIRMAFGYNYREEEFTQVVEVGPGGNINADPRYRPVLANNAALGIRGVPAGNIASGNLVEIQMSNVPFARGDQNVHEIFDEILVPILSDLPFIKQLNFNGAARWADYSGAGTQWSWKGGLDWAVYDELRFRSTYSQDVRAATIGEKFDRTGGIAASIPDYWVFYDTNHVSNNNNKPTFTFTQYSGGSPDIKPEKARTGTVGLVYIPKWLEGITFSADWYRIVVKDNIQQLGVAEVVKRCYEDDDAQLCNLITRGDVLVGYGEDNITPIYQMTLVGNPYINQNSVKARGIDFELDYRAPVKWFGGVESISWRLLGSYVGENSSTSLSNNPNYPSDPNAPPKIPKTTDTVKISYPEWVATLGFTYMRDPLVFSFTNRYTDKTQIIRNWNYKGTSTRWDAYDNTVESEIITDAQVSYRFDLDRGNLNLFFNMNNVFDRDPQPYLAGNAGATDNNSFYGQGPGLGVTGDLRGRRFVIGLKFEFN